MVNKEHIIILGVETSCDDTAVSLVAEGREILSNLVSSQVDLHGKFGGVVPEVASRRHLEIINLLVEGALEEAALDFTDLSAIAVTYGPGLVGALLIGVATAKALAYACHLPLIAVNHIEGHMYANFLVHEELSFPLVSLIVSGGHTNLVYMEDHGKMEIIGRTRDDAAGEVFDKVARSLDLGYPGGPVIDNLSKKGDSLSIPFPRAYLEEGSYDFSFSGLKSAVLNHLNRQKLKGEKINISDLAASFQAAVVEVLVEKTLAAAREKGVKTITLSGGVAANQALRSSFQERAGEDGFQLYFPPLNLCTDNGAMIACAGYYQYLQGDFASLDLNGVPGLQLASSI
ncbi:MAG: tRNA (adenosine(37)-N6)-threonylcarbamoyltransferase complex transferase subunit TsaD [Candidatus Syntrophonatronum acetioxidans]|uniref:tRNA N6-adenosine threonylcarbamoyltransferase n=1 Tax=Candidatus Syntrophonatronum acetioxidans TaxID=1795816 RepID=A0A424YAI1_9FIRM|nr:MAG: tRNA (adenosine(37)-N6)-threonylcarbamoyltransferase complex transferase subunit TsaD [Candidatus Syntrophonatronum acetioxidans]